MNELDKILLTQLYNERRYFKQFHHFIFSFSTTIYSALLGFILSKPELVCRFHFLVILVFTLVVFVVLPGLIIQLIRNYNMRIIETNKQMACIMSFYEKAESDSALNQMPKDLKESLMLHSYYLNRLDKGYKNREKAKLWKGHYFFMSVIVFLSLACLLAVGYVYLF